MSKIKTNDPKKTNDESIMAAVLSLNNEGNDLKNTNRLCDALHK